jgi:hypothetical protein
MRKKWWNSASCSSPALHMLPAPSAAHRPARCHQCARGLHFGHWHVIPPALELPHLSPCPRIIELVSVLCGKLVMSAKLQPNECWDWSEQVRQSPTWRVVLCVRSVRLLYVTTENQALQGFGLTDWWRWHSQLPAGNARKSIRCQDALQAKISAYSTREMYFDGFPVIPAHILHKGPATYAAY